MEENYNRLGNHFIRSDCINNYLRKKLVSNRNGNPRVSRLSLSCIYLLKLNIFLRRNLRGNTAGINYETHMNGGSFLLSFVFAYLAHKQTDLSKLKSKVWTAVFITFYFLIIVVARIYNLSHALKPSLLGSAFAGYYSHHHGIFLSILISRFILESGLAASNASRRVLRIADELFAATFLSSLLVTKIFISNSKVMLEMSFTNMVRKSVEVLKQIIQRFYFSLRSH